MSSVMQLAPSSAINMETISTSDTESEGAPSTAVRPRVLCVDDNMIMRRSLERSLASHFDVRAAASAEAAIALLQQEGPVAVVMTDLRMPGSDGLRLLKAMRKLYPDTVRVLYSGNIPVPTAMDAVNDAAVFKLLHTPFRESQLLQTLTAAAAEYARVQREHTSRWDTISECVGALSAILAMSRPTVFGRAQRVLRHVRDLAAATNTSRPDLLEMAALLADLGTLSLPPEQVERIYRSSTLSPEERTIADSIPRIADEFLAQMPALSDVRAILDASAHPKQLIGPTLDAAASDCARRAGILRIARDFDHLITSGLNAAETLDAMRECAEPYDINLLQVFAGLRGARTAPVSFVDLPITTVDVGMIFAQDVVRADGVLLVARGQAVTASLQQRFRNQWAEVVEGKMVRMLLPQEPAVTGVAA